ncbi:hypothetical protein [Stenotrophomonas maltophilia]|uniref:hypothetical protein n=1 Tax=Stenotrophomonas maltophilia TaxID=40324 RepID=UPI0039C095B1
MSNDKTTLADVKPGGWVRLGTPGARWAAIGEPDPHGTRYDCERAALVMGDLTDDELANAVFMHGNERQTMAELIGGATPAIAYLTAAKDRIRWLSRALAAAESLSAQPSPATCKEGLQVQPSPGGQEYAWNIAELVRVDLDRQSCPDAYMRIAMESVVKHLAARQPVGEIPAGFVLVPEKFGIPAEVWEGVEFVIGGPGTGEGEAYLDSTAWVGDLLQDDGSAVYGLHLSCDECPEEGSVTLSVFTARAEVQP